MQSIFMEPALVVFVGVALLSPTITGCGDEAAGSETRDCGTAGFDGPGCLDNIDECALKLDNCGPNAGCTDLPESFTCACDAGFGGDPVAGCGDIDGCAAAPCDASAGCTDVAAPGDGYICGSCPAGTVGDGALCETCPAGSFDAGASACIGCPSGEVQPSPGQTRCAICPAGTFDDGASEICADCAPGTVQPAAGQAECVLCPPGSFDNLDNLDERCVICPRGAVQPEAGQTACSACPAGTFEGNDEACTGCTAVANCALDAACTTELDTVCGTCAAGFVQASVGADCLDLDACAGDPCAGVTCVDDPPPSIGHECAAPDATSTLSCIPAAVVIGDSTTCTITPRQDDAVVSVMATSFGPTADSGSIGPLTPSVGDALTFSFTPSLAGEIRVGDALASATVTVSHVTDAGTTAALAGIDCAALLVAGVITSGSYWVTLGEAEPRQVYCEQQRHGGGWMMLYNSVGDPDGQTLAFWNIPYASRLVAKGAPNIDANYYEPDLYLATAEYLDVLEDLASPANVREGFRARADGIDPVTMRMRDPVFLSGVRSLYDAQFAAGWSAPDYDGDTHTQANCAESYAGVTQHYGGCWAYNLGADADGADVTDGGWGPHLAFGAGIEAGMTMNSDEGYGRIKRITRFVKRCDTPGCSQDLAGLDCQALLDDGVTTSGVYWIDPSGTGPQRAYCEQQAHGGGWTLLYNSSGSLFGYSRVFWDIPYAARFTAKGAPSITSNFYAPGFYRDASQYLDVAQGLADNVGELFRATADGIVESTMRMINPVFISGQATPYEKQFAGGWSSADYDGDNAIDNCAVRFGGTQHYEGCWVYSLAADADFIQGSGYRDAFWGPHMKDTLALAIGLTTQNNGGIYTRVKRISRFVKF